jgi:hypothetical protein
MTITLTKEEKAQIITSHQRSLEYNRYNLTIDLLQENSKPIPNGAQISSINSQMSDIDSQAAALAAELVTVNALTE